MAQIRDPQPALFENDFVIGVWGGGQGDRQKGREEKRWKIQDLRLIKDLLKRTSYS